MSLRIDIKASLHWICIVYFVHSLKNVPLISLSKFLFVSLRRPSLSYSSLYSSDLTLLCSTILLTDTENMRTTTLLVVLLAGSIEASIRVPGGGPYRSPHTGSSICGSRAVFKLPGNCASNVCTPPSSGNCDHLTVKRERTLRPIGNSPCDKSTCSTEWSCCAP
ncbi:hypothetical protein WAI453_010177 [Rhynchosporium graminicola]